MKKIIVLAGTREQFENFLNDNGITDSEAIYGFSPDVLLQTRAQRIETTGTFWERKDAGKLYELAQTRIFPNPTP